MTGQYYRERATDARRDADAANLANVRERCLRSEAAFLEMAARAERGARMREKLEAEKAAAGKAQVASAEAAMGM